MPMDRVLVVRLSALGDVAMTLPVIYSVACAWPQTRFTVLTRPFFRRLFINAPANVDFIDFDPAQHGTPRGLMNLIMALKGCGFTAVADLHDMLRSRAITTFMRGIPHATVQKRRRQRKQLTRGKSREFQRSYIQRYFDVFAALGFPAEEQFTTLFPVDDSMRRGVGVAPFARYATKTYPPELMEQVCRLLTDAGVEVTLFGGRGAEAEQLEQWCRRNPALQSVAGKLAIEEELHRMAGLKVMLTMDSANMHLASLVDTPVVSVWGSTIPQCGFLGYGQSADRAVWLDLPCQPCSIGGLARCPLGHAACLSRIAPQAIVDKLLWLL